MQVSRLMTPQQSAICISQFYSTTSIVLATTGGAKIHRFVIVDQEKVGDEQELVTVVVNEC